MRPRHFVIIGAQRCATTYLYQLLDEHPAICMNRPSRPEPKFFLDPDRRAEGVEGYRSQLFAHTSAELLGEKSTSYIEFPNIAESIARTLPGALLLAIVRNPVERAISNYWFSVEHGVEAAPLWEALNRPDEEIDFYDRHWFSVPPWAYLRRGHYIRYLGPWADVFGDRLRLIVYEDLVGDAGAITDIFRFLGVEASFEPPSVNTVVHAAGRGKDVGLTSDQYRDLMARFEPSNRALATRFGLDLSSWSAGSVVTQVSTR